MSDYVLGTIQDSFNIRILSSIKDRIIVIDPDPEVVTGWLSFLSVVLLGTIGIFAVLVVSDIFYPDYIRAVPFLGDVLDGFYYASNTLYEWFWGKSDKPTGPTGPTRVPIYLSEHSVYDITDPFSSSKDSTPPSSAGSFTPSAS